MLSILKLAQKLPTLRLEASQPLWSASLSSGEGIPNTTNIFCRAWTEMGRICRSYQRSIASLEPAFLFVKDFFEIHAIDESIRFSVDFALEELFTNAVKYNSSSSSDIEIGLELASNVITLTMVDAQQTPFDPRNVPPVDADAQIDSRQPGGLGIFLTQKIVDSIDYHYADGKGIITVTKKIPE